MIHHKAVENALKVYLLERENYSIKEIQRELNMSERTVYEYLNDVAEVKFLLKG